MIDEELVRCRPCGYVMKASDLGDVCPACGLPRNVFEPYRERVSANRLLILSLDIHPIAIHLSQTFVALTPMLIVFHFIFPGFHETIVHSVINFSIFALPFSLILSFISGLIDGITRFKTLRTPLLRSKIIFSSSILILAFLQLLLFVPSNYTWLTILLSLAALGCAVKLGLVGKHLIDVILPGTYVPRKKKKAAPAPKPNINKSEVPAEN
ncbi:MAG: rubrerythrin [Bacteroidota bacterium]|nr:rubrerythrin [Bacteroidota bacterium]